MAEEIVERNPENFSSELWSLKTQKKLCDSTIIVNDERINVHAVVLASSSQYFKSLFVDSEMKEVELKDIDKEILQLLIQYCYTGKIKITEGNAKEIFAMANVLSIMSIFESSSYTLEKRLNISNCLSIWKIARTGKLEQLKNIAFEFIKNNFEKVLQTDGFLKLDYTDASEMLRSNKVVSSELITYNSVKNWVNYNNDLRKKYFADLLDFVNLLELPRDVLISDSLSLCNTDVRCLKKYTEADQQLKDKPKAKFDDTVIAVGGNDSAAEKFEIYHTAKDEWVPIKINNFKRIKFVSLMFENKLMLIGGMLDDAVVSTVEFYDMKTDQLEVLPSLQYARYDLAAVNFKGHVFAIGGIDEIHLSSVEKYDPGLKKWTAVAHLKEARHACGACVFGEEIYIFGGTNYIYLKSIEAYNVSSNEWKTRKPMNKPRGSPGVAVIGKYIYVVGGLYSPDSAERYDPINDNWTNIHSPGISREHLGVEKLKGKLVVAGRNLKVELYDDEKDEWKLIAPLKNNRSIFNLVSIPWNLAQDILSKNEKRINN